MMCAADSIAEYHLYTHSPAVTQVPLYVALPWHLVLHIDPRYIVVSQLVDLLHQAQHHHLGSQQLLNRGGDQPDLLPPVSLGIETEWHNVTLGSTTASI